MQVQQTRKKLYIIDNDSRCLLAWVKELDNGYVWLDRFGQGSMTSYNTAAEALNAYQQTKGLTQ